MIEIIIAVLIFVIVALILAVAFLFHDVYKKFENLRNNYNTDDELLDKLIEINKKNSILSGKIYEKKLKNNQVEICNILILVRALYFRKIANLILDCIFKNYSNKFKELGIFKDNQGNKFSFFICASPINTIEPKKITSIIDFLMLIKEETSEIIHLNFILGGIEIPKENLINNQQIEESKEKENNDEEVHPSQGRFLNQFIVSINVIVNYLLNENKDNDIINKYINLIDPKDIVLTKDVDDRINEIMDNIL